MLQWLWPAVSHGVKQRADTIIGVIWALGMAFGIILIDLTPGYNVDLMSYLFGSILTVPRSDLLVMAVIGAATAVLTALYYQDLLAMAYDEEFARIRGVPVKKLYFGLIGMLAVTIVPVDPGGGAHPGDRAFDDSPLYSTRNTSISLLQMMVTSSILGVVFTVIGLWLSYRYNLTSGASIIMVSGIFFVISPAVEKIRVAIRR